ncbi:MAG: hypothetical protein CL867_00990 [Cytophagaceae bacterium]|nr:hypothetical protein [Cytophagaceae bacterium]
MLEIRPTCEHCQKSLSFDSDQAMICTFECTFCQDCVSQILKGVCANCGGDFQQRPIRPASLLARYPVSKTVVHKPIDIKAHLQRIASQKE